MTNRLKQNLRNLFHKPAEVDAIIRCGWLTYEDESGWQQYFSFVKPRSLIFLRARQRGTFDTPVIDVDNEIISEHANESLTGFDSNRGSSIKFSLKGMTDKKPLRESLR